VVRDGDISASAGLATQTVANAAPSGCVSTGIETGDVGHEANAKRLGTDGPGKRGRWSWEWAGAAGASLNQQQQTDDEKQEAGGQVPKRRSP
jgi:hypothetical protein